MYAAPRSRLFIISCRVAADRAPESPAAARWPAVSGANSTRHNDAATNMHDRFIAILFAMNGRFPRRIRAGPLHTGAVGNTTAETPNADAPTARSRKADRF